MLSIWDKGHPSLTVTDGFDYGHVVVESVENGNIVVSHAIGLLVVPN